MVTENILTLCEFEVFSQYVPFISNDLAFGMPTNQNSIIWNYTSNLAVDGNTSPESISGDCTYTGHSFEWHWWMVDLHIVSSIKFIRLTNDGELADFTVEASVEDPRQMEGFPGRTRAPMCFSRVDPVPKGIRVIACDQPVEGRYVRIVTNKNTEDGLRLCEVEIFGALIEPNTTTTTTATVNATSATRAATLRQWKEEAESHPQTSETDEAMERVTDGGQHFPTKESETVSWAERWVKWKEWMAERRIAHTKRPLEKTCLICC